MGDRIQVPYDLQTITKTDAPFVMGNFVEIVNKLNGHLGRGNLNFVVPETASGSYTGNGTANRVITLAFTPRYVLIFGNNTRFEALGDGVADMTHYQTTSAGATSQNNADWQGITASGFKLGSATTSIANKAATTYAYVAWR